MSKRPPGRPPLDPTDPSVHVGVTLPAKQFDALCAQAHRASVSLPEVIRRLITEAAPALKSKK
jgi:hypothetical protein